MSLDDCLYEFSEDGRLVKSDIVLTIYSPTPSGNATDPTTGRDYGILCNNIVDGKPCHSKIVGENETMTMVICASCGAMVGYRQVGKENGTQ